MEFIPGRHINAVCEHLQAVTEGEISSLLINIPPGHAKSLLVSVLWPAWEWTRDPGIRSIFASYALDLSKRDCRRSRELIESDWYQARFVAGEWGMAKDQNTVLHIVNTAKGERMSTAPGAKGTGFRGDKVVVDDPHNVKEQESETEKRKVRNWWTGTMSTRFNNPKNRKRVVVMQRIAEDDLSGHCIEAGYEHLMLPARYEPDRKCSTSIGFEDWREEEGELLFPQLFDEQAVDDLEQDLGPAQSAAQLAQKPAPSDGLIFRSQWLQFWWDPELGPEPEPWEVKVDDGDGITREHICPQRVLPTQFIRQIQSWDCSFKDSETSDYVVGQVWGALSAAYFLLDQKRAKLKFPGTRAAIIAMTRKWPLSLKKLVEDKANGTAIIQSLKNRVPGITAFDPKTKSKVERAESVTDAWEAGNVWLPHPRQFPWVVDFIAEHLAFDRGKHDDQVDAQTQALIHFTLRKRRRARGATGKPRPKLRTR